MAGFAPWDDTLEISVVDQMVNGMYDFPQQEWGGISDVAKVLTNPFEPLFFSHDLRISFVVY